MSKPKTKVQIGADEEDRHSKPRSKRRRRLTKLLAGGMLGLFAVLILLDVYAIAMAQRVLPGVSIGSTSFGGLTRPSAEARLDQLLKQAEGQKITLSSTGKTVDLEPGQVDFVVDKPATLQALLNFGHRGSAAGTIFQLVGSLVSHQNLSVEASFDEEKLRTAVADFAKQVDEPEVEPSIAFEKDEPKIVLGKDGQRLDQPVIYQATLDHLLKLNSGTLTFERHLKKPLQVAANGEEAKAEAKRMIASNLILEFPTGNVVISKAKLESFVTGAVKKGKLTAAVNRQTVSSAIDEYASTHDVEPTGARLRIDNGSVTTIAAGSPGKVTDRSAAVDLIAIELEARAASVPAKAKISLPAKAITSDISAETVSKLGIKELIGKATTDFSGSPKNRQHNIATGISFLTGIVVKPGEEFSTDNAIGQVDGSTGYLPELVIKENKTTPEFGGGLCQVSTTLFRSVMNAGLKVTERQNHSYRVTYYERGVGPGLDATIYAPHPDFRFKNDTPGAVLIQGYVEGTKATFEIYGTKDGRTSQIIGPTTLATYPPADPIRTETDTLARGVEKKTETAHPGAKTTATYIVTRDGKEINRQVFNSYYKPWPAQYLVGTNDSLVPAPPAQ